MATRYVVVNTDTGVAVRILRALTRELAQWYADREIDFPFRLDAVSHETDILPEVRVMVEAAETQKADANKTI